MRFILAPTSSCLSRNPTVQQSNTEFVLFAMNVITNNDNLTEVGID